MRLALLSLLAVTAGCGAAEPERGAGVYPQTPQERQAQQAAEFQKGERLSLGDLRRELLKRGIRETEIIQAIEPDHGIVVLRVAVTPARLSKLDVDALAGLELDSNYRIEFPDAEVDRAVAQSDELFRRERAKEIAVVKSHGDWDRIPRLRDGETITSLARRVEHWCDFDPGSALLVIDDRWLEYSRAPVDTAVREAVPGPQTDRFDCLRRTVYATQLRRHFIGYRGDRPPPIYSD
ncbi:hypothetical protein [Tsuneonella amylolytica]|uniref:hypothetical protein n=1 Tax=Tsuneonella amylolytica TaxID=2338327 RepID=UPI0013C52861|nr:hypothetical protein [Tsuneonella amylolytica]